MEARQKLIQERHRLALRFGLSESDIEPELVPLMLTVEQSINKIDQAAGKINESVKPVVYNNHYDRNASAWTALWGNISTGIAQHIVAISLVALSFLFCCVAIFVIRDIVVDQKKVELAEKHWERINRYFIIDQKGNYFIPKENYVITSDKKGIKLIGKEE